VEQISTVRMLKILLMSNSPFSTTLCSAASQSSIPVLGELAADSEKFAKNMPIWQTSQAAEIRIKREILWTKW
jgi:hypothetical protein